jgi:2-dehydro-3-deoxyphosphooctonate aldolase (KDO 8-P synthase)
MTLNFGKISENLGVPVLSDIHCISQVQPVTEILDVLQIPAFLCRQTDLVFETALASKAVNVKKGQFLVLAI